MMAFCLKFGSLGCFNDKEMYKDLLTMFLKCLNKIQKTYQPKHTVSFLRLTDLENVKIMEVLHHILRGLIFYGNVSFFPT